jgi:hypothetical protein
MPDLIALLEAVARIPAGHSSSFDHPAFVALREWTQRTYPDAGSKDGLNFALSAALDRLGLARRRPGGAVAPSTIADAAARLSAGFLARAAWRTHLCPLDVADELPALTFGPNVVRSLSSEELRAHFSPVGPQAASFDPRLAQFPWLIVREEVAFEHEPGRRAVPFLFQDLSRDFAEIEPHARKFPVAVEQALFALLLAPWEDLVSHGDLNWRAFQTPWVYTVDEDIFVRPPPLPSADSLSWVPDAYTDHDGERVEYERPLTHSWQDAIEGLEAWVNDGRWREVKTALASDLFSTPVVHFLVAAFLAAGIDEFIAHLTVLEAALGLRADRARELTVGARVQALLGDPSDASAYGRVFNQRSEYVHGRPMAGISGTNRNDARRLARRVADALVSQAQFPIADRVGFLQSLTPSRPPKSKS